jgi:ornithine carbamoyltransferase
MKRDLISFSLWTREELTEVLALARRMKSGTKGSFTPLIGRTASLIFEKPSLRTRVSFEVGITQLGGQAIFLQQEEIGIATRESVHDIASVLSRYNDLIVARTSRHQTCVQLAESATIPVINAMTDLLHPCQVLADVFTLQEIGKFSSSTKIVYVGDGNNVLNSWIELAEKVPMNLVFSCPPGYGPHPQILDQALASTGGTITSVQDPSQAVRDADVVYTDVWPRVDREDDEEVRKKIFKPYQVNTGLLREAKQDCVVMHRLPANRGEEITREVLDGKQSVVLQQAENRLHVQKSVMTSLLGRSD